MVCADVTLAFALFHCVQVAERDCKGVSLEDVKGATEKFGPLKAVLGAIPAYMVTARFVNNLLLRILL